MLKQDVRFSSKLANTLCVDIDDVLTGGGHLGHPEAVGSSGIARVVVARHGERRLTSPVDGGDHARLHAELLARLVHQSLEVRVADEIGHVSRLETHLANSN